METGKASTRAKNKYNAANYDRINLSLPKGMKDKIRARAEAEGMSVNEFIKYAVEEVFKRK